MDTNLQQDYGIAGFAPRAIHQVQSGVFYVDAESAASKTQPRPLAQCLIETDRFPRVHIVRDYAILKAIGSIRHAQYIVRQGKGYSSVVLDRDCLIELSDFRSVNLYSADSGGITAAMRISDIASAVGPQRVLYQDLASKLRIPIHQALTCTRLVRAPSHSGRHAVDLIRYVRWQTVNAGWRYCIMQTTKGLVPFFRKFEFYETDFVVNDPAAGELRVLILDTESTPTQKGRSDEYP